uniref:Uncharacterized protein n=1 Tax=Nelumbo nucifera TaxID=4432 RepID=A0A822Y543_NELNU|nr:TPA_asm: hypothetical protein HUJ06_030532 [Nelumbo nucifera]
MAEEDVDEFSSLPRSLLSLSSVSDSRHQTFLRSWRLLLLPSWILAFTLRSSTNFTFGPLPFETLFL